MRVVIALVGSLLLTVPAQGAPETDKKATTIRVISVTVGSKMIVDKAPKRSLSVGDTFWAKSTLRNEQAQFGKPKGALVGNEVAIYAVESLAVGTTLAIGTIKVTTSLPGGTIRSSDRRSSEGWGGTESQVTGGTGVFAGARGTVASEPLTGGFVTRSFGDLGDRDRKVYRIKLP